MFAGKIGIADATIGRYTKGALKISLKAMKILETKGEINPDFLQFGDLPELNTYRKPINDNIVELEQSKKQKQKEAYSLRDKNLISYSSISKHGLKSERHDLEARNIIRMVIDGIENPEAIQIVDEKFIEDYKGIYSQLTLNCVMIISPVIEEGDIVMLKAGID